MTLLLPREALAGASSPFALFFSSFVDPTVGGIVAIFVAIAALGALNGIILVSAEMPLAVAREGLLPAWFARFNRREIPWRIHLISSGLATLLVIANYTQSLAEIVHLHAAGDDLGVPHLLSGRRAGGPLAPGEGPAGGLSGLRRDRGFAAVAYCLWAFYGAGIEASLWSLGMTAVAIPVYLLMRAANRSSRAAAASPAASPESAA